MTDVQIMQNGTDVPLDPDAVYAVATNDFMRRGGDGYDVLRDQATDAYDFGPGLDDVLTDYLADNPDYTPALEGRISRSD